MTEKHRAKPEVRAAVERLGKNDMDMLNCVLELRSRVEALEAAAKPAEPNHPEFPDSSLVKRVQKAIDHSYPDDARAAIREVAAWLNEENCGIPSWTFLQLQKQLES
jgi:hypothetical protein